MVPRLFDPGFAPGSGPARHPTSADVRAWRRRKRSELLAGELVELYLRHCKLQDTHSATSRESKERVLRKFVTLYGHLPVIQLRPFHLTDFVDSQPGWKAPNTRRTNAATVQAVFRWGVDQERIRRHPFRAVRFPEGERAPEMTDDVFERLCKLANKRFEVFLRLLRCTGCREGELCRANWDEVDFERGVWTVWIHKSRRKIKRPKRLALTGEAAGLLRSVRPQDPDPKAPVLLNNHGRRWRPGTVQHHLRRLKDRLGIPQEATLHGIRHRFATAAIVNGAPLVLVAEQLGQTNTATVQKYYLHVSGDMEAIRAAAQLGAQKQRT